MRFLDIDQNEDEWLDARIAKLTGSGCSKIMANYGKAFGDPAKRYAVQIAVEQLTGKRSNSDNYSNSHMERGHEQEPVARALYEDQYFVDVTNGGFFDCDLSGCSPDGLVGNDGIIEIKSVISHIHYANIKRGGIDPSYKWQIYFNLLKTERQWIDFVSYCADFPPEKQLYIHRINKLDCENEFKMIADREKQFFSLVDEIKQTICS
jgi:hypothetical protein